MNSFPRPSPGVGRSLQDAFKGLGPSTKKRVGREGSLLRTSFIFFRQLWRYHCQWSKFDEVGRNMEMIYGRSR